MKIVLVYPGFKEDASGLSEPLGMLYIASALRKNHDVSFIDMTFQKDSTELVKLVQGADMVGMGCSTLLFDRAVKYLNEIKDVNNKIESFLGGSHATLDTSGSIEAGFDYVILGEGEITAGKIIESIEHNSSMDEIPGIAFKEHGKIIVNEKKDFVENLDELAYPARDLFDYDTYFKSGSTEIGVIATRGCPYNCLYCKPMVNKLFGNKVRKRSPKNVVLEIKQIVDNYGHLFEEKSNIWFKDDTLTTCNLEWFKEFKNELVAHKLDIEWGCHTRVDNVSYELLKTMKESGMTHISFGVESGSQKILNYYRKGTKVEQAVTAFELCKKLDITTFAYFMIGAIEETRDDLEETYQLVKKIKPDGLEVYTTMPYPGNDLFDQVRDNGQLKSDGKIDYWAKGSMMKLKYLTDSDLDEYRKKIYRWNNRQLMLRYFTSYKHFKRLIKYAINRPSFIINYLKRSL